MSDSYKIRGGDFWLFFPKGLLASGHCLHLSGDQVLATDQGVWAFTPHFLQSCGWALPAVTASSSPTHPTVAEVCALFTSECSSSLRIHTLFCPQSSAQLPLSRLTVTILFSNSCSAVLQFVPVCWCSLLSGSTSRSHAHSVSNIHVTLDEASCSLGLHACVSVR